MKLPTVELCLEFGQDRLLKAYATLALSISPLVDTCACHEKLALPVSGRVYQDTACPSFSPDLEGISVAVSAEITYAVQVSGLAHWSCLQFM
jgi:hypothetical protein